MGMRMGVASVVRVGVGGVWMHVMMMAVMAEQRRGRACRRRHLVHVQRPLLVLGLGTAQCRLQRHHALPVRSEAALLAGAIAVLAVPLVTLQRDL